ncbi:DUF1850 domain-containing protein [Inquilinus limosus]|uniref:DUF1850 domain-containing protein n=1 Tax=Inquilinus limosus MP06 TaxID=1398085 RepID=A0A0A0DE04_9PROT|nr:DUF1850 domain-containing protein [Inquilinus limosus]KGM35232.1 hypothetical protein P409_05690 [Inquilinus limosus MP06]
MSLCLAALGLVVQLGTDRLTLAWTHSVEKIVWEEDWRDTPAGLVIDEARVRGSGAGMDPPPEARFDGRDWRWKPLLPPLPGVDLRRSGATADWRICIAGHCRPMGGYLPADADPVRLASCRTVESGPIETR